MAAGSAAQAVTLAVLEADPHPVLARLRAAAPVSWVPVLGAWLVTGYDEAVQVMRDARRFTVDDPRFSTAKVVGPSMLSLDGARHAHHRGPFTRPFRSDEIRARLAVVDRYATADAEFAGATIRGSRTGEIAYLTVASSPRRIVPGSFGNVPVPARCCGAIRTGGGRMRGGRT